MKQAPLPCMEWPAAPALRHQQLRQHNQPAPSPSNPVQQASKEQQGLLHDQRCRRQQLDATATFGLQLDGVQARWERVRLEDEAEWQRQRARQQTDWLLSLAAQQRKWDAMRDKQKKEWQERRQLEQGLWNKWVQRQVNSGVRAPAPDASGTTAPPPSQPMPQPMKRKWQEAGVEAGCRPQRSWGSSEADQTPLARGGSSSAQPNPFNAEHSLDFSSACPDTFKSPTPAAGGVLLTSPFAAPHSGSPAAVLPLPLPLLAHAPVMLPACTLFEPGQQGSASGMIPTPQPPAWLVDQLAGQQAQHGPMVADLAADVAPGVLEFSPPDDLDTLGSDDWWLDGLLSMA